MLTVGITYYTGLVDTVAHIPERCYVANGFEQVTKDVETMPARGFADGKPRDVKFTFITLTTRRTRNTGSLSPIYSRSMGNTPKTPSTSEERCRT